MGCDRRSGQDAIAPRMPRGRRWYDDPDIAAAHERVMVDVSAAVYAARRRHGWSLDVAAAASGIHPDTLQSIEKTEHDPQLSTLVRAFYALGYEVTFALRPKPVISG